MTEEIFGTDGVRGTPGHYPLDERTVTRLGAAIAHVLNTAGSNLLVVRDTRESGLWLEQLLAHGVSSARGTLVSAGIMPTPAAAFLVESKEFDGAIVISASHNTFPDNGIKVLTGTGEKASSDLEGRIEACVASDSWEVTGKPPASIEVLDLTEPYAAHVQTVLTGINTPPSTRIAVDCANGATSIIAPRVLRQLGFDVVVLNAAANGRNINAGCGSTNPEDLQRVVTDQQCQLGLAFDGDGDRVILVDHRGQLANGDVMLFVCARSLKAQRRLIGNGIVATVMSNIGLEVALRDEQIVIHRCPVGDREVYEEMVRQGIVLGGEQSGHLIFSELLPTGDGLLTALSVLRVMSETGQELADLRRGLEDYPQLLLNVPVREKPDLSLEPEILAAIREAETALEDEGRVLVRYSGTEPLLRIMIEGRDEATVNKLAESIAAPARQRLG